MNTFLNNIQMLVHNGVNGITHFSRTLNRSDHYHIILYYIIITNLIGGILF